MNDKVILIKQNNYNQAEIDLAVKRAVDSLGGMAKFVKPGNKVLLKVNLVAGHEVEKRVNTDPAVVKAAAKLVLECGGEPVIADSPGIGNFDRIAETCGIAQAARELNIKCVELKEPVKLELKNNFDYSYRNIEAAKLAVNADVIINLAKLKTHGQMQLTLGVKNIFGCIVGRAKAGWHYNVGLNRDKFAALLIDLYKSIAPGLTIIDGVIGMHGDGPTSGEPYNYNLIGAAENALYLDFWLCKFMGLELENFALWRAAKAKNLIECDLNNCELAGDFDKDFKFNGVKIPRDQSLRSLRLLPNLPFVERAMTSRPVHVPEL
ncbi:MAG: DUF362 domain-containing protein, partial [Synergistaceae bacterium]|nr:DUF362 domain-containing protein [Synergistaceae bacterium]